ncbi:hypothetical protein [Agrococcus citreus]|jgi:hypothetical protein|uniref:Uncharacterized protein n=1 Tax=Agrococcus citreus TaxID=84643 RepID=A0ABN1YPE4_9MICO
MLRSPAPNVALTEAQIDELLLELNTQITGPEELRAWASHTTVAIDRLTATPTLTYLRLVRRDPSGASIVLMLLDGAWERTL